MNDIVEKGLEAILPVYIKDIGNCTIIFTKEDEVISRKDNKNCYYKPM